MSKEQISEVATLLDLLAKLSEEERRRFLYMIEGAAVVTGNKE